MAPGFGTLVLILTLFTDAIFAECSAGCTSCSGSTCLSCESSYFLTGGFCSLCPEDCNSCNGFDDCTSCKPNKYGLESRCAFTCDSRCSDGVCSDDTGYCVQCKPGLYGFKCGYNCSNCADERCDLRSCTLGCKPGYYEYKTELETFCQNCSQDCKYCNDSGICYACNDGFHLYQFRGNGKDHIRCILCTLGSNCSNYCIIQGCNQCKVRDDSFVCTDCPEGYRFDGNMCIMNTTSCSSECSSNCDENGICLGNCNAGWTGEKCTDKCSARCMTCDKSNDDICLQCKDDFYTANCSVACSTSCIKENGTQTCRLKDGYCLNGCEDKFLGDICDQSCSDGCVDTGVSPLCERSNGTCKKGCKDGYIGDKCDITDTSKTTAKSEGTSQFASTSSEAETTQGPIEAKKDDNNIIIIGAASGGGVLVLILVIILVVCLLKRRRKSPTDESVQNGMLMSDNKDNTKTQPVNHGQVPGREDYIYAQPDKSHIKKKPSKMEISKPQKMYDNIAIELDVEETVKETDVDKIQLEELEEGSTKLIETGNTKAQPVNHGQAPGHQDYIYAQPDKSHIKKKPSKMEISKPQKMYDNIAIDLDVEETVKETDVDKIQLEELEEGSTKLIETEVKPPSTDLYYNTASLIRSRIMVSDLQEYVKKKTDYEKEFEKLPKGLTRTCDEALKQSNRVKNRYNGIYAYDATRVVLKSKNYINANYIDGHKRSKAYIASLGPTESTMNDFEDFWEMIWQERTDKIMMLTNLRESGKMKCEKYWPEQRETKKYSKYKVTCTAETKFSEFTVREFTINVKSETRQVAQYHYTAWPDKSVPDSVASLLEFRDKVEQSQTTNAGPMVVHCSAGIGRTGTYIALDTLIKDGKDDNYVDIFGCIMALRGQRAHMVQNLDQYIFLHPCVLYALTCDPEPLTATSIANIMTDEKISQQYQAFAEVQVPPDKDRRSVAYNKSRKENRKGADVPGDDYRVWLTAARHDYINAVYVNGYEKPNKFIVTQTPLPNTVEDFVSMLYQEKCTSVVCLDDENIKDKTVGNYLPNLGKVSKFGHFQVKCKTSDSVEDVVIRELVISLTGSSSTEELKIKHYQFRGWNTSESVPRRVRPFLKLVKDVEMDRKVQNSEQPIVVHCLTGAGRSGIFCAVSLLSEKLVLAKQLSVLNTICQVRSRRRSSFQNVAHFRFCYKCVNEMSEISESNTYYNVDNM